MAKIDGEYGNPFAEKLLKQIDEEDSITKRHHLMSRYLYQRVLQVEKILTSLDNDDDIDLPMVI